MNRAVTLFALLIGAALAMTACSSDGGFEECAETPAPADETTLKWHGQACTSGTECAYGVCYMDAELLGTYGQGICTKPCNCGAYSNCQLDEERMHEEHPEFEHIIFTCLRPSSGDKRTEKEMMNAYCAPTTNTTGDEANAACTAYNEAFVVWARTLCTGGTSACITATGANQDTVTTPESLCAKDPSTGL